MIGLDGSGTFVVPFTSPPTSGWNWKLPVKVTCVPARARKHAGEYTRPGVPPKLTVTSGCPVRSIAVARSQPFTSDGMVVVLVVVLVVVVGHEQSTLHGRKAPAGLPGGHVMLPAGS